MDAETLLREWCKPQMFTQNKDGDEGSDKCLLVAVTFDKDMTPKVSYVVKDHEQTVLSTEDFREAIDRYNAAP